MDSKEHDYAEYSAATAPLTHRFAVEGPERRRKVPLYPTRERATVLS
jgi:hypothetical protein